MKKKIMFLSLAFVLSASMVFAQGAENKNNDAGNSELTQEDKGNSEESKQGSDTQGNQSESPQGNGADDPTQAQNQEQERERINEQTGESNREIVGKQARQQNRATNTEQLKTMIKNKKQEMDQEVQGMEDEKQQKVYQNQNKVREAVHALLAAEDLLAAGESTEGKDIGHQVSAIAREFNNSVDKTIPAEEKIQKRNRVVAFFFGGDEEAAEDILEETNKNKERSEQLKQLKEQCDCDEGVRNIIQEQIQNIEQEQNRLEQVAQKEKSNKGIFGWLFGWIK
ncbi:MAG: hypothetical protein KAQ87_01740 [Candidatus Pacebacteria bacterium]|nr:hypothetical protein [Candidatus Paceibacterota bacterium]